MAAEEQHPEVAEPQAISYESRGAEELVVGVRWMARLGLIFTLAALPLSFLFCIGVLAAIVGLILALVACLENRSLHDKTVYKFAVSTIILAGAVVLLNVIMLLMFISEMDIG